MPVTFGAVGDIISVSLLVKEILLALNDSKGSSAQYQEIIRELYILDRALLEIDQLCRQHESTPELTALSQTAKKAVSDCRNSVKPFLDRIAKYKHSLCEGSKANAMSRATRKVQFAVVEKDDLARFRAEISAHSLSLNMLLNTASVKLLKLANGRSALSAERIEEGLAEIRERLVENENRIEACNATMNGLADVSRLQWLRDLGTGLKSIMGRIFFLNINTYRTVIATYRTVVAIQAQLPSASERSMVQFQEPTMFEDALGRIFPVHSQLIETWETFDMVLGIKFKGAPGHDLVKKKGYTLSNPDTKRDIDRGVRFCLAFLPGQKVEMSIVFRNVPDQGNTTQPTCPRCHSISDGPSVLDGDTQCVTCGMIFRRVEEVLHADSKGSHPDPASGSKKRPLPSPNDEDRQVSAFKRVRLVTNKREHSERAATPEREEEVSDRIRHSNGNANDILSPKVSRIRSSKRSSAYKVSYSRSQCPPDYWECPNCGASNSGITADFCPVCDYRAG